MSAVQGGGSNSVPLRNYSQEAQSKEIKTAKAAPISSATSTTTATTAKEAGAALSLKDKCLNVISKPSESFQKISDDFWKEIRGEIPAVNEEISKFEKDPDNQEFSKLIKGPPAFDWKKEVGKLSGKQEKAVSQSAALEQWGTLATLEDKEKDAKIESFKKEHGELYAKLNGPPPMNQEQIKKLDSSFKQEAQEITDRLKKMDQFRDKAMKFVEKISYLATEAFGLPKGEWEKPVGNPGAKSDVDSTYSTGAKATDHDLMLAKTAVETAWTHMFKELSGTQVDLERYLAHPGRTRNLATRLHTPEAQAQGNLLELKMSALVRLRAMAKHPEKWEAYKEKQYALHPNQKEVLKSSFEDLEAFEKMTTAGINKQAEQEKKAQLDKLDKSGISAEERKTLAQISPEDRKRAAAAYKTSRLMALSKAMSEDNKKIEELNKGISSLKKLINSSTPKEYNEKINQQVAELQKKCDELELSHGAKNLERYSLFDEAYLTAAAIVDVVEDRQVSSTIDKTITEQMAKKYESTQSTVISQSKERFELRKDTTVVKATLQQKIVAAFENLHNAFLKFYKYEDKLAHATTEKERNEILEHYIIDESKYPERSVSEAKAALYAIRDGLEKNKGSNPNFEKQFAEVDRACQEADKLHKLTAELENRKRVAFLGTEDTFQQAKGALKTPLSPEQEKALKEVNSYFEPEGVLADSSVLETQKYDQAMKALVAKGVIPKGYLHDKKIKETIAGLDLSGLQKALFEGLSPDNKASLIQAAIRKIAKESGLPEAAVSKEQVIKAVTERLTAAVETGAAEAPKIKKSSEDKPFNLKRKSLSLQKSGESSANVKRVTEKLIKVLKFTQELTKGNVNPKTEAYTARKNQMISRGAVLAAESATSAKMFQARKNSLLAIAEKKAENSALDRAQLAIGKELSENPVLSSGNPKFDAVLRARSGMKDTEVNLVNQQAAKATVERFKTTIGERRTSVSAKEEAAKKEDLHSKVSLYMESVEKLCDQMLQLTSQHNAFPLPKKADPNLSLVSHWQRADAAVRSVPL